MHNQVLTPADYWNIIRRRRMSFLFSSISVFALIVVVAMLLPSIYRSYATIMIEEQQIPSDFVMTTVNTYAEQRVENIRQRALSFSQLWEIINKHNLYPDLREKWTPEEVVGKMREDIDVINLSAEIFDRRLGRPTAITTAFTLAYEGKNPQAVLRVTDMLTTLFLEQNLQVRQQRVTETSDFLADEAERVNRELLAAEREVAEFKKTNINRLPELFQVNVQGLNTTERNLERLISELASLEERQGYLNTQLANISPHLESAEGRSLRENRLSDMKLQLVGLQQRYTDAYPDIATLKAQIRELETQRDGENNLDSVGVSSQADIPDNPAYITLSSQLAAVQSDIDAVREQLASFETRAENYRQRIENTPRVEEEYVALVNSRNALQAKYNDLIQKHQEAQVAQALERDQKGERFTLIEPARLPEKPHKPNRLAIILIGSILGLGAGISMVALREFSDQSVLTVDSLAALTKAPVLAGIPMIVTAEEQSRSRVRRLALFGTSAAALCGVIVFFHFFVMDLDIFWAKAGRWLARL